MTQYRGVSVSQPLYQVYEENRIVGTAERKIAYLQINEYTYILNFSPMNNDEFIIWTWLISEVL